MTQRERDSFDLALSVFARIYEVEEGKRRAELDQSGLPEAVRLKVEEWLRDYENHRTLLNVRFDQIMQPVLRKPSESLPLRAGPYQITGGPIGEGGMGTVFVANREDLPRPTALKFLSLLRAETLRGFERERETLGKLKHPNVATIYDTGVESGIPWIAMELVEGTDIASYCKSQKSTLQERLKLFLAACEAAATAHQNLIVHLDLKPANILVSKQGVVKLLDFGLARVLGDTSAEACLTTPFFSVPYTAPEQILGSSVSTRADVYSLGVVLHQLAAGTLPKLSSWGGLGLSGLTWPLPSKTALLAADQADEGSRLVAPWQWSDIDYICHRACQIDPHERYASVLEMSADIKAILEHRPLPSKDWGLTYRFRKYYQRNRRTLTALSVAAIALFAIAVYAAVLIVRAEREEAVAIQRSRRIQSLLREFVVGDEHVAGPGKEVRLVDVLDRNAHRVKSLQEDPEVIAELEFALGDAYDKLGLLDKAATLMESSLERRKKAPKDNSTDQSRSLIGLAAIEVRRGNLVKGKALAKEAEARIRSQHQRDAELARLSNAVMGLVLTEEGNYAESLGFLTAAVTELRKSAPTPLLSESLGLLANAQYYLGKLDESERTNLAAMDVDGSLYGKHHPSVAIALRNLGHIGLDQGKYNNALARYSKAMEITSRWYGEDSAINADNVHYVGRTLQYLGRYGEAQKLYQRAYSAHKGSGSAVRIGAVCVSMGELFIELGKASAAERWFREAQGHFSKLGAEHPFGAMQRSNLAEVALQKGKFHEASNALKPALNSLLKSLPENHRAVALAKWRIARALEGKNLNSEAVSFAESAYRTFYASARLDSQESKQARATLVRLYRKTNRIQEATALERQR